MDALRAQMAAERVALERQLVERRLRLEAVRAARAKEKAEAEKEREAEAERRVNNTTSLRVIYGWIPAT